MIILLIIIFLFSGLVAFYHGQYDKTTFLDRPLIMDSVIFTFIANISILLLFISSLFLFRESPLLFLELLLVLLFLNFVRKRVL